MVWASYPRHRTGQTRPSKQYDHHRMPALPTRTRIHSQIDSRHEASQADNRPAPRHGGRGEMRIGGERDASTRRPRHARRQASNGGQPPLHEPHRKRQARPQIDTQPRRAATDVISSNESHGTREHAPQSAPPHDKQGGAKGRRDEDETNDDTRWQARRRRATATDDARTTTIGPRRTQTTMASKTGRRRDTTTDDKP